MNDSISRLITGCWIATQLIEINCKVGNPQLSFTSCTGVEFVLLGGEYLARGWSYTGIHLCPVLVQIHLIRWNISFVYALCSWLCFYIKCAKMYYSVVVILQLIYNRLIIPYGQTWYSSPEQQTIAFALNINCCWHLKIYDQDYFHTHVSWAWK